MNNRANIMFFIEQLCDVAQRENRLDFIRMIQRDILSIIDLAAPTDGSGAANVKVVRRVRLLPHRRTFQSHSDPFYRYLAVSKTRKSSRQKQSLSWKTA